MSLDPDLWGPPFWAFLHNISFTYPNHPNAITKKKYYDFVHSIPLFIPVEQMSSNFAKLLEKYPVTPYLDNKESFVRWTWFLHNKVNEQLEKPGVSLSELYKKRTQTKTDKYLGDRRIRQRIVYASILISLIALIVYVK